MQSGEKELEEEVETERREGKRERETETAMPRYQPHGWGRIMGHTKSRNSLTS